MQDTETFPFIKNVDNNLSFQTTWYGMGSTLFNLTRGCHSDPCTSMHQTHDSKYCKELPDVHQCTQCCDQDLCNKHMNEGVNGGDDVSGCMTTLVLSAVALMIML